MAGLSYRAVPGCWPPMAFATSKRTPRPLTIDSTGAFWLGPVLYWSAGASTYSWARRGPETSSATMQPARRFTSQPSEVRDHGVAFDRINAQVAERAVECSDEWRLGRRAVAEIDRPARRAGERGLRRCERVGGAVDQAIDIDVDGRRVRGQAHFDHERMLDIGRELPRAGGARRESGPAVRLHGDLDDARAGSAAACDGD